MNRMFPDNNFDTEDRDSSYQQSSGGEKKLIII